MPDHARAGWQTDEVSEIGELLEMLDRRPAWHADAACKEHPDISFFPGHGDDIRPAVAICRSCLAYDDCLAWALAQGPTLDGIWAGTTNSTRRRIRMGRAA